MTLAQALEALHADYLHDVDEEGGWRYLGTGRLGDDFCPRCEGKGWVRHKVTGSKRITCPTCYSGVANDNPLDAWGSIP